MTLDLSNKVALITGATSGIGEATAELFLESGSYVFATGRDQQKLVQLQNRWEKSPGKLHYLQGDIRDAAFRNKLIESVLVYFKKLDILVNAAGIIKSGTIESTLPEDFDELMDVNLRSVFHLIQLCVPHLKRTKGNVVNVSSIAGLRSFPGILAYCVSKAALDQLTRCAALELAADGVRINAVNPGVVQTHLHLRSGMDQAQYANFLKHSQSTHPLGRVGQPEEIARLVAFLASDDAAWITGATYKIDGGRFLTCAR